MWWLVRSGNVHHAVESVPEVWANKAVDEKVETAVENNKKSGENIRNIIFLGHIVLLASFITQLNILQPRHLYHAQDDAGGVEYEEDHHQHHHGLRQKELLGSLAAWPEEFPGLGYVRIYLKKCQY